MKKILFICDSDNFPKGAFQFIKLLHENESLFVKGIFFSQIDFEQLISGDYIPTGEPYVKLKRDEKNLVKVSKEQFIQKCNSSGIKFHINNNNEEWSLDLFVKESRFSDLVLMSEELFCSNILGEQPNYFMREVLHGAECPVMVVPESFKTIERIAIAIDGKKESVFALKLFTYLLPQYTDLPAEFVFAKSEETGDIPDLNLLEEYSSLHFNSVASTKLDFDPTKFFTTWLEEKKNVLLVTGSYARSALSNLLNKSFVDGVIHNHLSPVFIAHHI